MTCGNPDAGTGRGDVTTASRKHARFGWPQHRMCFCGNEASIAGLSDAALTSFAYAWYVSWCLRSCPSAEWESLILISTRHRQDTLHDVLDFIRAARLPGGSIDGRGSRRTKQGCTGIRVWSGYTAVGGRNHSDEWVHSRGRWTGYADIRARVRADYVHSAVSHVRPP